MKVKIGDFIVDVKAKDSLISKGDDTRDFLNLLVMCCTDLSIYYKEKGLKIVSEEYKRIKIEIYEQLKETGFYD